MRAGTEEEQDESGQIGTTRTFALAISHLCRTHATQAPASRIWQPSLRTCRMISGGSPPWHTLPAVPPDPRPDLSVRPLRVARHPSSSNRRRPALHPRRPPPTRPRPARCARVPAHGMAAPARLKRVVQRVATPVRVASRPDTCRQRPRTGTFSPRRLGAALHNACAPPLIRQPRPGIIRSAPKHFADRIEPRVATCNMAVNATLATRTCKWSSGAFHTRLIAPAAAPFSPALQGLVFNLQRHAHVVARVPARRGMLNVRELLINPAVSPPPPKFTRSGSPSAIFARAVLSHLAAPPTTSRTPSWAAHPRPHIRRILLNFQH